MDSWTEVRALITAAQTGNRQAFNRLVAMYSGGVKSAIHSQAGKQVRQTVEVEDLVQETFLRAFQSIGQFRGENEAAFRAWLNAIAAHVVQDQARRPWVKKDPLSLDQVVRAEGEGSWSLGALIEDRSPSASRSLRQDERFERLKQALATLRPDHSQVIYLARVQGLPIKEVARLMERTPAATSMLLLRALMKLKSAFGSTESFHLPPRSLEREKDQNGN